MRIFAIVICCMQCAFADSEIAQDVVFVGGGDPRLSIIRYENGMTIEAALSKAGLGPSRYYKEQVADEQAFPFRILLYRKEKTSIYDPRIDAESLRTTQLLPHDSIELKDYRLMPDMIEARMKRLSQMIELGSLGISGEMLTIARLQHEYASWKKTGGGQELKSVDSYVREEVERFTDEGKGQKTVDFLRFRLSELKSGGLGPAHPDILQISALIELFTAQQQRNRLREQDGADQPATAPQLKSEGKEKPKPEAEVRPR